MQPQTLTLEPKDAATTGAVRSLLAFEKFGVDPESIPDWLALVGDAAFIDEVDRMFESDFAQSRVVGPEEYTGRWFGFRLAARLARLTAPVL